jgi:hypothetical protein
LNEFQRNVSKEEILIYLVIRAESAIYDLHFPFNDILNAITMHKSGILSTQLVDYKLFIENYAKALGHHVLNTALEP